MEPSNLSEGGGERHDIGCFLKLAWDHLKIDINIAKIVTRDNFLKLTHDFAPRPPHLLFMPYH